MLCRVVTEPSWFLASSMSQTHKTVGLFFMTAISFLRGITPIIAIAVSLPQHKILGDRDCAFAWSISSVLDALALQVLGIHQLRIQQASGSSCHAGRSECKRSEVLGGPSDG